MAAAGTEVLEEVPVADSTITLTVTRYDPSRDLEPQQQNYAVPYDEDMVVLDALNHIKDHLDGSVSYRWSCRMGICGSCGMSVNGTPRLTCSAFLRDYLPGPVIVEPLANFAILRDLVVDISDFMQKLPQVQPWIVRKDEAQSEDGEYRQTPEQIDLYHQFSSCINCMLCYSACPVYALDPGFLGPAAIALARRYSLDSRDQGGRGVGAVVALCAPVKTPVSGLAPALESQRSAGNRYRRPVPIGWWLRNRRYLLY